MQIKILTRTQVIAINKTICQDSGELFGILNDGSVESSLAVAFYPGDAPFQHGGLAGIAGAMAFYFTKNHCFQSGNKRTAAQAALVFLKLNGYDVAYPIHGDTNGLADAVLAATVNEITIDELKDWFEAHKVRSGD